MKKIFLPLLLIISISGWAQKDSSKWTFSGSFNRFYIRDNTDTVFVQMLISDIDTTSNPPYLQCPIFARFGYAIMKGYVTIGYLDYFKKPLPSKEKVWMSRRITK
jgi:hypothetical protein